ncbi:MAG: multidrug transporter ATPase [Bacilli bacterium]|nr:multidrug transporter ATPase [Bacilli bacterium]
MLQVQQVSKLYENHRGVDHIDFSMSRGEIVGFLGPNGAGKTTTMRMITGYLNPSQGQILVDGLSMKDHPRKARSKIGYLPETPPLYPEMTVQSYLKFIADLRDIPVKEQKHRIGSVVEKLGLQGREKQIIRGLSKGYKQRLGLAQAILHNPDLLILDEPTSGLDPKQIIEIRQLIRELGEKHTVLLSTHILPEVNALCDRVLIINQGKIVLDDKPEQIINTMGETFEVSMEVKGPRETIVHEIQQMETVGMVTVTTENQETVNADHETSLEVSSVKLRVSSKDRQDIREALFFRMAELRLPIIEMKKENLSLEEIFLKLTTDEKTETFEDLPTVNSLLEVDEDA